MVEQWRQNPTTTEGKESWHGMMTKHGTKRSWLRTMAAGLDSFAPSALAALDLAHRSHGSQPQASPWASFGTWARLGKESHGSKPLPTFKRRLALRRGYIEDPTILSYGRVGPWSLLDVWATAHLRAQPLVILRPQSRVQPRGSLWLVGPAVRPAARVVPLVKTSVWTRWSLAVGGRARPFRALKHSGTSSKGGGHNCHCHCHPLSSSKEEEGLSSLKCAENGPVRFFFFLN